MIKKYEQFNPLDPYGEEDWENKKDFVLKSVGGYGWGVPGKIVYIAYNVENEDEAREHMKKNTGVTDEYGPLEISEITLEEVKSILREKANRKKILDEESGNLTEEIDTILDYMRYGKKLRT